jgi:hypothetical protein
LLWKKIKSVAHKVKCRVVIGAMLTIALLKSTMSTQTRINNNNNNNNIITTIAAITATVATITTTVATKQSTLRRIGGAPVQFT